MQLSKSDVIDALKLRAFALKFNLTQPITYAKKRIAEEELQAIEARLFAEDCMSVVESTLKTNSVKEHQLRSDRRQLSFCR